MSIRSRSGPEIRPHIVVSATECSDIRESGHSRIHKDTPAWRLCYLTLKAQKPRHSAYPSEIKTLVNRLRARRLDLGIYQKDVAAAIGGTPDTIGYWENNRSAPP